MSFTDGYLYGLLRSHSIQKRNNEADEIEILKAQRDALKELIKVLVSDRETVEPLYHQLLKAEFEKRNISFPT